MKKKRVLFVSLVVFALLVAALIFHFSSSKEETVVRNSLSTSPQDVEVNAMDKRNEHSILDAESAKFVIEYFYQALSDFDAVNLDRITTGSVTLDDKDGKSHEFSTIEVLKLLPKDLVIRCYTVHDMKVLDVKISPEGEKATVTVKRQALVLDQMNDLINRKDCEDLFSDDEFTLKKAVFDLQDELIYEPIEYEITFTKVDGDWFLDKMNLFDSPKYGYKE